MADNTTITPGTGLTIATDDVTGIHYQRVKLVDGTLDSTTAIASGAGVAAAGLRVAHATDDTVIGALAETAPATDTASSGLNGRLQRIAQNITTLISSVLSVVGNVASGGADSGNPVKIGGRYNATQPEFTDGQRGDVQIGSRGALHVNIYGINNTNTAVITYPQDGFSEFQTGFVNLALASGFNGTTWDRWRSNLVATLLASAARTVTTASPDQTNYNSRGLHVVLDMTVVGTGSVTLTIQGKDALSGQYYTILAGVAVVANGTNVYRVYPGLLAAANAAANDILPRTWRVNVVANNANPATYSVGVSVIL